MNKKLALISDFDGTISNKDFFYYIADEYFDNEMLKPWHDFLSGKKKHFMALAEMFAKLRIPRNELNAFIKNIKLDKYFFKVAEWCRNEGIPVVICSAGNDYYIKKIMGQKIKKYDIKLVSNRGRYSEEYGLQMKPNEKYYDENLGVSKAAIVKDFQKKGYEVIYCGDGLPDIGAAKIADKVFARAELYKQCKKMKIKVEKLNDFMQVGKFMEGALK